MDDDTLFDVETPLGFRAVLSRSTWRDITTRKHPSMAARLADVQLAVTAPDEVRLSVSAANVFLFYRVEGPRTFVCAVARRQGERGTLITAYMTVRLKRGATVWPS